ncbi:hypothetical protein V1511DRAFT_297912 [Dipodascopsis uninucleata]
MVETILPPSAAARTRRDIAATGRLNKVLSHLSDIFPDTEIELLRKLITDHEGASQLYAIVEMLLSSPSLVATRKRALHGRIQDWERFRSNEYKTAVENVLKSHYRGLHKSTINNVLSQYNHSFTHSLRTLSEIASQRSTSWTVFKLFSRNKRKDTIDSLAEGIYGFEPRSWIGNTGSFELDAELTELDRPRLEHLELLDRDTASKLNTEEYLSNGQLIECECCFGDYAFEDLACCNDAHFFCRTCLENAVKEGLYGQGDLRSNAAVKCISASASPSCNRPISNSVLRAALPQQLYAEFERVQVAEYLTRNIATDGLVLCPFCGYGEHTPSAASPPKLSFSVFTIPCLVYRAGPFSLVVLLILALMAGLIYSLCAVLEQILPQHYYTKTVEHINFWIDSHTDYIARAVFHKRHGTTFCCKNPECGRVSCTECGKEFLPFHKCYEQEEDRLRIYVERAMANAVKRTCPECHVSFIKSEGCNKLVCVCGYAMCYVCRKDIHKEGYQHFCEHFRHIPGSPCTECDKCDLYKTEDETIAIERAAKEAEAEFVRTSGMPPGLDTSSRRLGPSGAIDFSQPSAISLILRKYLVTIFDVLIAD